MCSTVPQLQNLPMQRVLTILQEQLFCWLPKFLCCSNSTYFSVLIFSTSFSFFFVTLFLSPCLISLFLFLFFTSLSSSLFKSPPNISYCHCLLFSWVLDHLKIIQTQYRAYLIIISVNVYQTQRNRCFNWLWLTLIKILRLTNVTWLIITMILIIMLIIVMIMIWFCSLLWWDVMISNIICLWLI